MGISNLKAKKMIVIGCPGSGKSYFSIKLSEKLNIPRFHLDCLYWNESWIPTPKLEFCEKIKEVMKKDEWIIDGNYQSTLEMRFMETEAVFFLDIPEDICIKQEAKRRGKKREDLPDYLIEEYDPEFINFIKNFKNEGRVYILDLIDKYKDKEIIILHSKEEEEKYLSS